MSSSMFTLSLTSSQRSDTHGKENEGFREIAGMEDKVVRSFNLLGRHVMLLFEFGKIGLLAFSSVLAFSELFWAVRGDGQVIRSSKVLQVDRLMVGVV